MVNINLTAFRTMLGAHGPAGEGTAVIDYWAGSSPYVSVDGHIVTFPDPIKVPLTGEDQVIELEPIVGCCLRWSLQIDGIATGLEVFTEMPTADADFGDLAVVDPDTFQATGETVTAWEAVVGQVETLRAQVADDAAAAAQDRTAAGTSAFNAGSSAAAAQSSEGDAVTARNEARAARDQAQVYAANTVALQDDAVENLVLTGPKTRAALNGTIGDVAVPNAGGTLGTELIANGSFSTDLTGWAGTNWAWLSGAVKHTPGSEAALIQAAATATLETTYAVTFTISGRTAGDAYLYFGGGYVFPTASNGTFTGYITATSADALRIIPSLAFDGSVDSVSVRPLVSTPARVDSRTEFTKPIKLNAGIELPVGAPVSIGYEALRETATGTYNTPSSNIGIGYRAGKNTDTGHVTAVGYRAGEANTDGVLTAFGKWAGMSNTIGHTTVYGNAAGMSNTTGNIDAYGDEAGADNTTGTIAVFGYYAGHTNVTGTVSAFGHQAGNAADPAAIYSAFGHQAGQRATGTGVTAFGHQAAQVATTGRVTAVGHEALRSTSTGHAVGLGYRAGVANTSGAGTFIGYQAGLATTTGRVTAVGSSSALEMTTGNGLFVGHQAGYGLTPANAPKTDQLAVLIGDFANRSVPSATFLEGYVGVGYGAVVGASNTVAVGRDANAGHASSVALGASSQTSAVNQVMVGDRDIESTRTGGGITLKSPDGTRYKVTVANGGTLAVAAA
ncbi:hypothetical protein [Microbacterium lacus]|uniref:hypothetical protein n=1 Tax=Microbacterium lacus TaxID=415217 RepID=UPI000C2C54BB|nr:hypothetical protein [Microbacterium lacus]